MNRPAALLSSGFFYSSTMNTSIYEWLTAKEIGSRLGLHESTVQNRLIRAGIIDRLPLKKGFSILPKLSRWCRYEDAKGKRIIKFEFEEIRHYVAVMYHYNQD